MVVGVMMLLLLLELVDAWNNLAHDASITHTSAHLNIQQYSYHHNGLKVVSCTLLR
jgi:hypothetical protein